MCNYIGNERWVNELETDFKEEFQSSTALPWVTIKDNKVAGEVRVAGGDGSTAGNVTFVTIFEAGCVRSSAPMFYGVDYVSGTWCHSTSPRLLSYVQRLARRISTCLLYPPGHVHALDPGCLAYSVIFPGCTPGMLSSCILSSYVTLNMPFAERRMLDRHLVEASKRSQST
jgi:hypothetical protein